MHGTKEMAETFSVSVQTYTGETINNKYINGSLNNTKMHIILNNKRRETKVNLNSLMKTT